MFPSFINGAFAVLTWTEFWLCFPNQWISVTSAAQEPILTQIPLNPSLLVLEHRCCDLYVACEIYPGVLMVR